MGVFGGKVKRPQIESKMSTGRYINSETRRTLRKEVNFCCPICGCPILESHHIVPWEEIRKDLIEEMEHVADACDDTADYVRILTVARTK